MKCRQCNKTLESACSRSDCGINAQTTVAAQRRQARDQQRHADAITSDSAFAQNYARVAAWSEGKRWQKPSDQELLASWAAATPQGKLVIQAIARSL